MPLSVELSTKLLGAIETDTLVFLCGAGLSMPSPSYLPSAARVAEICYDKWLPNENLDTALKYDVDALAGHFHARGDFASVFIPLVPWNDLAGEFNQGHVAISDMLVSRAAHGALSANFDTMIETWAEKHKVAMQGALTGQEATTFQSVSNPLLKFHGCMRRARNDTLWTQGQLVEPAVADRVQSCSNWMNLHLPGKHLVVVGFWTDWGYLNDVLAAAFNVTNALSVTVIDPNTSAELQGKAPDLWDKLNDLSGSFTHMQESGAAVLEELRLAYSRVWARKFYTLGKPLADGAGVVHNPDANALSCDQIFDLRRDAQGVSYSHAATLKEPPAGAAEAAFAHIQLLSAGAVAGGSWLNVAGRSVRIVNGQGQGIDQMREGHKEPTTLTQADIVLCAGAVDLGVPAKLIASGKGSSVVSPAAGGGASWLTRASALAELGL
ncbi:SIR2 family protein [Mesorhizobium sp. DCY119]|uniref:SIR2 family protein n=1 Tax=Mesorhizobium sp. DCY119 TaxID=2108445 RepID=UPI000E708367|nr:SIR2 family protein [Mesorhizobium sp. DCY119]RJG40827.1 SIR2 family protein [Mesorhizobium sp. DCY119]